MLSETDPLGNTTTSTYDPEGNLATVTDPLGGTTGFTYDSRGKPVTSTDARGKVTTNTYDMVTKAIQMPETTRETPLRIFIIANAITTTTIRIVTDWKEASAPDFGMVIF